MKRLLLALSATLALVACAPASHPGGMSTTGTYSASNNRNTPGIPAQTAEERAVRNAADYWQRTDSVSALYMTGPKAQHQLHIDIASCVAQVKELVRLGSISRATPPSGIAMSPDLREGWNSPTRDGPLFIEYTNFQDFDGCMRQQGWERVNFVKPVAAQSASRNYVSTILGHPYGWSNSTGTTSGNTGRRFNSGDANYNR
jgi:hypothetical protein